MLCCRPFPSIVSSPSGAAAAAPSVLYFHETEDTDWDNGGNWFEDAAGTIPWGVVPTAAQTVVIQSGTCDADGTSASLIVESLAVLETNNGYVVNNYGIVTTNANNGTVITISGGTVTANNGTVSTNNGTVSTNNSGGTVTANNGIVTTNASSGTIIDHNSGATVALNNGLIVNANTGSIVTTNNGTITNDFR